MFELKTTFSELPNAERYWVAFSGGLDSVVLLHLALQQLDAKKMNAIHVHHGLQVDADAWVQHCQKICTQWHVPLVVEHVQVDSSKGDSPEAAARDARYAAILKHLTVNDCLLTAHHCDDQAETLLLQLFRGSGPKGLAAMPAYKQFDTYRHARPLLTELRSRLQDYAREHKLPWVEDESNQNTDFDRNFLRQKIFPELKKRWPSLSSTLTRAARLQADTAELLEALAEIDFQQCHGEVLNTLLTTALEALPANRAANVVRYWISKNKLKTPSAAQLDEILNMLNAGLDRNPCVTWFDCEVRRYKGALYCYQSLPPKKREYYEWLLDEPLEISASGLCLTRELLETLGLRLPEDVQTLDVKFRQGAEKIKLNGCTQSVKKLLQAKEVPPWLRDRLPMLYLDGELIAVLGLSPALIADGFKP